MLRLKSMSRLSIVKHRHCRRDKRLVSVQIGVRLMRDQTNRSALTDIAAHVLHVSVSENGECNAG